MLKGIAVNTVIKLVLGVLIAALVISIFTSGPIGQALNEAFESIGDATDRTIEIEDSRRMSDLALFVKDRALNKGCRKVEQINNGDGSELSYPDPPGDDWDGGYLGLEGTYLTQYPNCYGGEASPAFQGLDGVNEGNLGVDDNFMPGIYSRENFEITSNFTVKEGSGSYYLENELGGVLEGDREQIKSRLEEEGLEISCGDVARAVDIIPPAGVIAHSSCIGYTALRENTETVQPLIIMEEGDLADRSNLEGVDSGSDIDVEFQFCKGDEGYIQSSRGSIDNDGHSSEEPLIPMIVIEEIGSENCGQGVERFDPYSGPQAANQIYIRARSAGVLGNNWPEAQEFELRSDGNRGPEEDDWIRDRVEDPSEDEYELPEEAVGGKDRCEINYRDESKTVDSTLKTYSLGTVIQYNQTEFTDIPGSIETSHTLAGTNTTYPATDLINKMSLDSAIISNPERVGELRPKNNAEGVNELHGDLLCGNPRDKELAKWHLCNEDYEGESIKTAENPRVEWTCEEGDWRNIS